MKPHEMALDLHWHGTDDRAVLVSRTGEFRDAVWLPLSLVRHEFIGRDRATVTLPRWLAAQKGLAAKRIAG